MKRKHEHIVENVEKDSIAEELGIEPGDRLLSINGQEIEDIFDYQYYVEDGELLLLIEKPDGEQWELEIEKDPDESLGIGIRGRTDGRVPFLLQSVHLLFYRSDAAGGCGIPCILRTTIPDFLSSREIM